MHNEQDATMLPNALFSLCDESQAQPEATELREEIWFKISNTQEDVTQKKGGLFSDSSFPPARFVRKY